MALALWPVLIAVALHAIQTAPTSLPAPLPLLRAGDFSTRGWCDSVEILDVDAGMGRCDYQQFFSWQRC